MTRTKTNKRKIDDTFLVPQSQNSTDSQAIVEDYIALLSEWQEFYKEIIQTGFIIKNSGILKVLKHKKN